MDGERHANQMLIKSKKCLATVKGSEIKYTFIIKT